MLVENVNPDTKFELDSEGLGHREKPYLADVLADAVGIFMLYPGMSQSGRSPLEAAVNSMKDGKLSCRVYNMLKRRLHSVEGSKKN